MTDSRKPQRVFISICVIIVLLSLLANQSPLFAAEVYYVPGNKGQSEEHENPSYSLKQRLKDLFDFTSNRPPEEKSGKISGSILTQAEYNRVTGNKGKSFLQAGKDYLTEVRLNLQEKLRGNYNLEGQLMLRKTDNIRIDGRHDVRIKQSLLTISNPDNLYLLGDFYGELSPFTLGSSLEGFATETKPSDLFAMKQVVARQYGADEVTSKFQRNVLGSKFDVFPIKDSDVLSDARFGFQVVTTQDDSSTAARTPSSVDLRNNIFSSDGDITFAKLFSVNYEFARSQYLSDEDAATPTGELYGNAFHVAPQLQFKNTVFRHVYNYIEPTFYTENGSAFPDKIQHMTTIDHRFSERVSVSLMENYYWDNLSGSALTKRTTSDAKNMTVILSPLTHRRSFRTQINMGYNVRHSDDTSRSVDNQTSSFGVGVNDRWKKTDWGVNYEYREFKDRADASRSDDFNRFSIRIAREYSLFERRLYLSMNPGIDMRKRQNTENKDLNLSVAFSGQYDLNKALLTRFGYNVLESRPGTPGTDYFNARSYTELDWSPGKNKNTHIVLRWNLNRYLNEDSTLNYKESQTVLRCVYSF